MFISDSLCFIEFGKTGCSFIREVLNQNDHPNLISYSLPMGTYLLFLMDGIDCNENQYDVFDISTNDALTNN